MTRRRLLHLVFWIALLAMVFGTVFNLSYRSTLSRLSRTADIRLAQASDRLLGQLESYRELPNFLARHPVVTDALKGRLDTGEVNDFLLNIALLSGSDGIYILDTDGVVIGASDFAEPGTPLGRSLAQRPDVIGALNGNLGFFHATEGAPPIRDFFFSRGVIDTSAPPIGVLRVKVDVDQLEFEWRIDEEVVIFKDRSGVVFSTNRQELALTHIGDTAIGAAPEHYSPAQLRPFPRHSQRRQLGHDIWRVPGSDILPPLALVRSRFIPQLDMTAQVFVSTAPARKTANLQAALAAVLTGLLGLIQLFLAQRRRRLADLLALEEAANQQLEARVTERTAQLERAQSDLVQAGKLSALGQMSAGLSHELNQPLAAIQNYAVNASTFLDRNRPENARENLTFITEQTARMDRIIRNLRAFARKEPETAQPVDLTQIIPDALKLAEGRLRDAGIEVVQIGMEEPLFVTGGHVRLQQVLLNLLTNAADAMEGLPDPKITLSLTSDETQACLEVSDTGPGLVDPDRVFEPFYSTKNIGASKGMGLGLSISHGIVGTFGGHLTAHAAPSGGALFRMTLPLAKRSTHDP